MSILESCDKRRNDSLVSLGANKLIEEIHEISKEILTIANNLKASDKVITQSISTGNGTIKHYINNGKLNGVLHDFRNSTSHDSEYRLKFMDGKKVINISTFAKKLYGTKVVYKMAEPGEISSIEQKLTRTGLFYSALIGRSIGVKSVYAEVNIPNPHPTYYDHNGNEVCSEYYKNSIKKASSLGMPNFIHRVTNPFLQKLGLTVSRG